MIICFKLGYKIILLLNNVVKRFFISGFLGSKGVISGVFFSNTGAMHRTNVK